MLIKFFVSAANNGYLNGLANEFNESTNSIRKELNNLSSAGYLLKSKQNNRVIYNANTSHPMFAVLQKIVRQHLGLEEIVEAVIEINAIIVAINPSNGIFVPKSNPKTSVAPKNPSKTPIHCLKVTFSFNIGPLRIFVKIGWRVTINAAILVGIPIEIEKKTPPRYNPWKKTPLKNDSTKFLFFTIIE